MRRHQESHEAANQRSIDILDRERRSRKGYDGEKTREAFRVAVKAVFSDNEPRKFQLDVAEAMTLGLDSTVIAGTGSGKTLPWAIPLLLDENKDKVVLVISPLKALQTEHASFFRSLGITAAPVNGDTWKQEEIRHNVTERKYRILLASPEMCFVNPEFSKLLRDATWSKSIMFVVIDEAHCITQWGQKFRTQYSSLNKLWSYIAPHTPLLLTSATLPPQTLSNIRDTLEVQDEHSFDLNLGNDRSNIMPIVWPMKGGKEDLGSLDFVVSGGELRRTVIYVNEKETAREACEYLQALIPEKSSQIDFIHSGRCSGPQKRVLRQFQAGEINILCATEVVGMGTDLKNVTLMVQYMVPSSLSVWVQRAGRAGRSGLPSCAILLYEPSVVQRVNTRGNEDDDDDELERELSGDDFRKRNVEDSLRAYVMGEKCRRALTDEYFDNPPRDKNGYSVPCCDNCLQEEDPEKILSITDLLHTVFNPKGAMATPASQEEDVSDNKNGDTRSITSDDGQSVAGGDVIEGGDDEVEVGGPEENPNGKQTKRKKHHGDQLTDCRLFLLKWRNECWKRNYSGQLWGPNLVLPDPLLTKFATWSWVKIKEEVTSELGGWIWVDEHLEEVLEGLAEIDTRYDEAHRVAEEEKQRKKAEEDAERRRLVEEKRRLDEEQKEEARRQREEERERMRKQKEEDRKRKAAETKKRNAEERLKKKEEKKRQKEIEKEEEKRVRAEEERRRMEDTWWRAEFEAGEARKRQRVGYDTFIRVPPPDPPLLHRPRPRPTKILPPMTGQNHTVPSPNIPFSNGFAPTPPAAIAPRIISPLPSIYPPPRTTPLPHPQPRPTRLLLPTSGQENHVIPSFNTPLNDESTPMRYQTFITPIARPSLPSIYSHPPTIHPPPDGFTVGPSAIPVTSYSSGYSRHFGHLLPLRAGDDHTPHPLSASYEPMFPCYNGARYS